MSALFQHPFIFGKTTKQKYHVSSLTAASLLEKLLKNGSRFKKNCQPIADNLLNQLVMGASS